MVGFKTNISKEELEKAFEPSVCNRCGNRLALGMAIIQFDTMNDSTQYKLCGACQTSLKKWLKDQSKRFNRPT
jgi:hypothetical protein